MIALALVLVTAAEAKEPRPRASAVGWEAPTGVGVMLGEPTGITAKRYLDPRAQHAIEGAIGIHSLPGEVGGSYVHGTYHLHPGLLLASPAVEVPWRLGGGAFFGHNGAITWYDPPLLGYPTNEAREAFFGARGVAGIDVDFVDQPVQVYVEVVPSLALIPQVHLSLGFALGGRWYF